MSPQAALSILLTGVLKRVLRCFRSSARLPKRPPKPPS